MCTVSLQQIASAMMMTVQNNINGTITILIADNDDNQYFTRFTLLVTALWNENANSPTAYGHTCACKLRSKSYDC